MFVSKVELYCFSIGFEEPVTLKDATLHRREGVLIRLTADDGSEGWGEAAPLPGFSAESLGDTSEQLRVVAPLLADREMTTSLGALRPTPPPAFSRLAPSAMFGLELASLNLVADSGDAPLQNLLTSQPKNTIPVNGLISGSTEKVLAEAVSLKEAGYGAVKLKVGRRGIAEDVEVVLGVAGILGDGISLRLDANRAWGFDEALAFAEGISGVKVAYVEEPLAQPGRLAELAGEWGLPVALDESLVGMAPEGLAAHPYAAAVVLKPTLLGGVALALRFADAAKSLGMAPVVSSSYEAGVGTGALVALAAAVGEEPAGLDTYRALAEDVIRGPLRLPSPTLDVRETVAAAQKVDVGRLEPVPLR